MKKVTSSDVARLAGVSQSTVSLILNKKSTFSDETCERVYAAAQQLGYRLPAHGEDEHAPRRQLIVVLMHTMSNMYYSMLAECIEQYAESCGYRVIVCNMFRKAELEKYYLELSDQVRAQGVIYTFLPNFPRMVERMSKTMPMVLVGEKTAEVAIPSVETSNVKEGALMAEYLIKRGHQNFAFLSTPSNNVTMSRQGRLEGIRQKLAEYGLEKNLTVRYWPDDVEFETVGGKPYEYEVGRQLALQLVDGGCKATAYIGVNDSTALGVLNAFQQRGLRVPEDYAVCGFDNIFLSQVSVPPLTTVDHLLDVRGRAAVDLIFAQAGIKVNGSSMTQMVKKIEYESKLVVRGSTEKGK